MLPLYVTREPAIPDLRQRRLPLSAGDTLRFYYDTDDVLISEVIVETRAGRELQRPYRETEDGEEMIIWSLESLEPVAPQVRAAVEQRSYRPQVLVIWAVVSPLVLAHLIWRRRRRLRAPVVSMTAG